MIYCVEINPWRCAVVVHGVPEPVNGAGLTSADPDQSGTTQDPSVILVGDVDQVPEGEPATGFGTVNDVDLPVVELDDDGPEYHDLGGAA